MGQANEPSGGTGQNSHPNFEPWMIVAIIGLVAILLFASWLVF